MSIISGLRPLLPSVAGALISRNAAQASLLICSLLDALISKGMRLSRTTAFMNTVIAAVLVKPKSSQMLSTILNKAIFGQSHSQDVISDRQKQVLKLNFNYLSTQEKKVRCKVQSEGRFGGHQGARDS